MNPRGQSSADKPENYDQFGSKHKNQRSIRKNYSEMSQTHSHGVNQFDEIHVNYQFDHQLKKSLGKQQQIQKLQVLDSSQDMILIQDLFTYLQKFDRCPFVDVKEFRAQLKASNSVFLNLLSLISSLIDPCLEIKNYQDERLQEFLKRFGYPYRLSKTRMMSLGSSHTFTQTLHLLRWLAKIGEMIQDKEMFYEQSEYNQNSLDYLFEKQLEKEFQGNTNPNTLSVKKFLDQSSQDLNDQIKKLQQQISQLNEQISKEKSAQPNLTELDEQIQQAEKQRLEYDRLIEKLEGEISQIIQEEEGLRQRIIQQEDEILSLKNDIDLSNNQVQNQYMNLDQANEMIQKTNSNNFQLKKYIDESQKMQKQFTSNQERNQILVEKIDNLIFDINHFLEMNLQEPMKSQLSDCILPQKFNIFDKIPIQVQLKENPKGVDELIKNENELMDITNEDLAELELVQKIIEDRQLTQNQLKQRRKSVMIYDFMIKRDVKKTQKLMIPAAFKQKIKQIYKETQQTYQSEHVQREYRLAQLQEQQQKFEKEEIGLTSEKMRLEEYINQLNQNEQHQEQIKKLYNEQQLAQQKIQTQKQQLEREIIKIEEQIYFEKEEIIKLQQEYNAQQECFSLKYQEIEQIEDQSSQLQNKLIEFTHDILKQTNTSLQSYNQQYLMEGVQDKV